MFVAIQLIVHLPNLQPIVYVTVSQNVFSTINNLVDVVRVWQFNLFEHLHLFIQYNDAMLLLFVQTQHETISSIMVAEPDLLIL